MSHSTCFSLNSTILRSYLCWLSSSDIDRDSVQPSAAAGGAGTAKPKSAGSAGIKAGGVAGMVFGLATFAIAIAGLFGYLAAMISDLARSLDFSASQTALLEAEYSALLLVIALSIGGMLGAILGFVFGTFANKIPLGSLYVKAAGFGFCLWLLAAIVVRRSILSQYGGIFVLGLVLLETDAVFFAYLFNRWMKPESSLTVT